MNRPIKFRGKSIFDEGWLYGDLVHSSDMMRYAILVNDKNCYDECEVIPSTISQFTGLYDKNGKEIYEGDIILYGGSIQHEVMFRHGAFGYLIYGGEFISYAGNTNFTFNPLNRSKKHEVIGNIHDNPELLKGGEK